jgi:hypothetical protein
MVRGRYREIIHVPIGFKLVLFLFDLHFHVYVRMYSLCLCLQVFDPIIQSGRDSTRETWAGP